MNIENKKIFLDEKLKKYILPMELRNNSVSEIGGIFTPGTRIAIPEKSIVRLFTSWASKKSNYEHFDIDLSSVGIDSDGNSKAIAFYNQNESYATSSGDVRHCYGLGVDRRSAEFLDIDMEASKIIGIRYFTTISNLYSSAELHNDLCTDVEVHSGIMILDDDERKKDSEEDIDINQAFFKLRLTVPNKIAHIGIVLDVEKSEIIILDQYFEGTLYECADSFKNTLKVYKNNFLDALDYQENMFDFLTKYCKANNYEIVEKSEDCEIYISYEDMLNLKDNQTMFNVSNNLEKILNLLN